MFHSIISAIVCRREYQELLLCADDIGFLISFVIVVVASESITYHLNFTLMRKPHINIMTTTTKTQPKESVGKLHD